MARPITSQTVFRALCAGGIQEMDNACKVWQDGICFGSMLVWEVIIQPPLKGCNCEAAAFSLRLCALSSPKWRLHVWLCQLLICRQYVKVAHVSDFHGHPTKGEQIADKGAPFPFSSVVRTTKKYSSDNKFYFKAFLTEGWLLHSFY